MHIMWNNEILQTMTLYVTVGAIPGTHSAESRDPKIPLFYFSTVYVQAPLQNLPSSSHFRRTCTPSSITSKRCAPDPHWCFITHAIHTAKQGKRPWQHIHYPLGDVLSWAFSVNRGTAPVILCTIWLHHRPHQLHNYRRRRYRHQSINSWSAHRN